MVFFYATESLGMSPGTLPSGGGGGGFPVGMSFP